MRERALPNRTEHAPGSCRGNEADGTDESAKGESCADVVQQGLPWQRLMMFEKRAETGTDATEPPVKPGTP